MDGLSAVRQSLELARNLDAPWIFAGDMKQPKTSWPQSALTGLHEIFREYKRDVHMIMVAGNHDAQGEGGSGLAPFEDCATIIEDRPESVDVADVSLVCCPWNGSPTEAAALLEADRVLGLPRVLVAHGFLQGCFLGPEDVRLSKGTPVADYGDFDLAIFGDVHKAQWRRPAENHRPAEWGEFTPDLVYKFAAGHRPVFYCGSPYQQNWGERNDAVKGALVVDTVEHTVRVHRLAAPQYAHLEMDYSSATDFLKGDPDPDHFYRIVYSGVLCSVTDRLRKWGESCRSFQLIVRREEKSVKRAVVHAGMSTPEILENYMKAKPSDTPKGKTLEAGLRLAVEVAE
jgi:DNA repair exonuclease SbcCD nuclease subunit